jgi:broad specificity phosphatase PhoE
LSFIYFIRHGQAGPRDNYDVLSELGQSQARLLGEHLTSHGVELEAVYSGNLRRQRQTAEIVCDAYARAGHAVPDIVGDERWNEFNLLSVYRAIEGRLMEDDADFARDVEEMQEAIRKDPHAASGATGRCDATVIRAWMENRYADFEGETWATFRQRVRDCATEFHARKDDKAIAIFTSATPIAILTSASLGVADDRLLDMLGVIYNTSVTVMRGRGNELRLFTFNSIPHLHPSMRTFR